MTRTKDLIISEEEKKEEILPQVATIGTRESGDANETQLHSGNENGQDEFPIKKGSTAEQKAKCFASEIQFLKRRIKIRAKHIDRYRNYLYSKGTINNNYCFKELELIGKDQKRIVTLRTLEYQQKREQEIYPERAIDIDSNC